MDNEAGASVGKSRRVRPWMYVAVLLVNVLVFIIIGWVYSASANSYSKQIFNENVRIVENLNAASANAASSYTASLGIKVDDIVRYAQAQGLSYDGLVGYIGESNTDPDRQFQLVLSGSYGSTGALSYGDYSGVSIRTVVHEDGSLETLTSDIKYGSGYYDILRFFTDVGDESYTGHCFVPEFTDPDTKQKCFAVYRHIVLQGKLYTILLVVNSQTAMNSYGMQAEFEGQSTVIANADGDYIVKNSDFRNVNFFDYIVNYNDLTLDWRTQLQQEVLEGSPDISTPVDLFYKNHQGADCLFSVASMENGWYSITCVPLSSFSMEDDAVNYALVIMLIFGILFVVDGFAIYFIWKAMNYNITVAERATAEANDANQAKSRFLSTMSHELRTPLNAIIGFVSLSEDSIDNPPVLKDYLKKIDISSKLLLQLISDILDVSAIESNKMKLNKDEFDMTRLINSLSVIYYDQCAAKGISFSVVLKNMRTETLIGDSVRLNQVLLNFLSNAVKFTPKDGKVVLTAETASRGEGSLVIRFTVSDTGCGISEELRERLFNPFERASGDVARKYSGTGLGLSIAKNLIELMGGTIGVESKEGTGSSFWAEIPFDLPADTELKSFSSLKDLRAIAAIGDVDECEYIGQILSSFGMEHSLTDNVDTVLSLLNEAKDGDRPYKLCILDWKLADLDGLAAAQRIREEFSEGDLRIIILAYDLAKAGPDCVAAGADRALSKPVFPSMLYNALKELSSGEVAPLLKPEPRYDLKGKRVLLVEDNKLNAEIGQKLLTRGGVEVEVARDGQEGYDRFTASAPGYFDAILMDVQMPVMDGYQASAAIRASSHPQAKTVPILAMTADAFAEDIEKARAAGMNEHISKPVVTETLYSVLRKYLFE